MSEYFSSFIVEPVVRQARRLSRLSTGEEFLPAVPESVRTWYPSRLWNTSPPASISEDENQENYTGPSSTVVGQWATPIPSPPLEAMESGENDVPNAEQSNRAAVAPFPPLEPQIAQQPRPARLGEVRAHSDTSINPLRELPDRSRIHEDDLRGHSQSDPVARVREESGASSGASSVEMVRSLYENNGQTRSRDGSGTLPADDGMGPLRQKINEVWQGEGTVEKKSQLLHLLMMEQYNTARLSSQGLPNPRKRMATSSRPSTPSSLRATDDANPGSPMSLDLAADEAKPFLLCPADLTPTYAPADDDENSADTIETQREVRGPQLGCMHYKRNVKLQCYTCKLWYTCRYCHDDAEDHVLPRQETENMLCMICKTPQPASQTCRTCGEQASCYYCSVCKLWNNDPGKSIYHCDDCGICRLGEGLGRDFFHCKTCAVCMSIGVQSTHRCIERSTKCDCPICGEYLFTSAGTVVFMKCGHSIHDTCFKEWCRASYKCPICSKSVVNMESQFRNLDRQIDAQPMPEEYRNTRAYVHCNDCSMKGTTKYHWLGLKCERCESYNTQQHYLLEADGSGSRPRSDDGSTAPVTASPPLPQNVSDEAVAIPNSRAASRRASFSMSEIGGSSGSPWLLPQVRGARSMSPTVGNYFGTGLGREEQASTPTPRAEDLEYDFWGRPLGPRQSPTVLSSQNDILDSEEEEEDDDDWTDGDDEDDEMEDDDLEDDDDDDIDQMALIGHR
jgi:Zinc-ribbon/CHY zinc finger/Ring finger domain